MEKGAKQEICEVRKSNEAVKAFHIAERLSDYFDKQGLRKIEIDTKNHILYGATSERKWLVS